MRFPLIIVLTVIQLFKTAAQDSPLPLINSKEVIEAGVSLHDEGEYLKAIEKYYLIPESDTNYVYMLSEVILSLEAAEQYDSAITIAEEYKDKQHAYRSHMYNVLGSTYDDAGNSEKAIRTYSAGLLLYPHHISLHYNLALTLYNEKRYDEFEEIVKKGLKLNPFHAGLHTLYGTYMELSGSKTKAAMSYAIALAIVPTNNRLLVRLNDLLKNAIKGFDSDLEKHASFEAVELLLNSNIALDPKFMSDIVLEAPVSQQMELLIESVKYKPETADFSMDYYVAFYEALQNKGLENAFIHHILKSVDNKDLAKWLKKNTDQLANFYDFTNSYFKELRAENEVLVDGQPKTYTFWYFDNNVVQAIGNTDGDNNVGLWKYFYSNGELSAIGEFNEEGKKEGSWKYYFEDGLFSKEEFYVAGLVEGELLFYNERGYKNTYVNYKNDLPDGQVKLYYPWGTVKESWGVEAGLNEGLGAYFNALGDTLYRYNYVQDSLHGLYLSRYNNGQVRERYNYDKGVLNGQYESFYLSGKAQSKGLYVAGEFDGNWIGWYENGTVEYEGSYDNGNKVGVWNYYDEDGWKTSTNDFTAEGYDEVNTYFYENGEIKQIRYVSDDLLVGYQFYSPTGEKLAEAFDKKGDLSFKSYHENGQLQMEGQYTKGKLAGNVKYYFDNGQLETSLNYVKGDLEGEAKYYFKSGQQKILKSNKAGQEHGYYRAFHSNGTARNEGWMQNGEMQQQWNFYNLNGTIESSAYYLNGKIDGKLYEYDDLGRLSDLSAYDEGDMMLFMTFDTLGNVIDSLPFNYGSGKFYTHYANGAIKMKKELIGNVPSGDYVFYFPNGKVSSSFEVAHGADNGQYFSYHANGQKHIAGQMVNNKKEGTWYWYYEDGTKESVIEYKAGERHGQYEDYYDNGQLSIVSIYKNGMKDGVSKYYLVGGEEVLHKIYEQGDIIAYEGLNAEGEWKRTAFFGDGELIVYQKNGQKAMVQTYKDGYFHGEIEKYYANGKPFYRRTYDQGNEKGVHTFYHENGQLKEEINYKNGARNGLMLTYSTSGQLLKQTNYVADEKNGWEKIFNSNGSLKKKTYYRDDIQY